MGNKRGADAHDRDRGRVPSGALAGEHRVAVDESMDEVMTRRMHRDKVFVSLKGTPTSVGDGDAAVIEMMKLE